VRAYLSSLVWAFSSATVSREQTVRMDRSLMSSNQ